MSEAKPCPTCGYQIDRVERINNENARLRASEQAWKILAKRNADWAKLPGSDKEAALHKALEDAVAESEARLAVLEICRECLGACIGTPDWYKAKAALSSVLIANGEHASEKIEQQNA